MKTATAVISRRALRHNLQLVRRLAPHSRLIAVIKANAYGHGALATALALKDADGYGVARLSEALALRQEGITKPILLLEGFLSKDELPLLAENHFETVVHNIEQLFALEQTVLPHPITVCMKLDTGMHRLGIRPDLAEAFYQRLCNCRNVVQPVNIMSHLCRADEAEEETTHRQLECFDAFVQGKPGVQSITASSGILLWSQAHRNQVRPGIILYGVSPMATKDAADFGFEPCMTLTSCLIAVREHKAGEPVGYGGIATRNGSRPTPMPAVLGHAGSGIIEAVGKAVHYVRPGDHVVMNYLSCGECRECIAGRPSSCFSIRTLCFGGCSPDGSHAIESHDGETLYDRFFGQSAFDDYTIASERNVIKVDADLPLQLLGPLGCGLMTGAGAIWNELPVVPSNTVAIFGTGAVGLGAIMVARIAGATTIIAVDRVPERLILACAIGQDRLPVWSQSRYPLKLDTLIFGGISRSIWI